MKRTLKIIAGYILTLIAAGMVAYGIVSGAIYGVYAYFNETPFMQDIMAAGYVLLAAVGLTLLEYSTKWAELR